jgi:outer membrane lipoprotein-sorting protein
MRTNRWVVLLLFTSSVFGQQQGTKDPTAMAIAQQSLSAMGGTALPGFQDVTVTGTTTAYGDAGSVSSPITLMATGTSSVASNIQRAAGTRTSVTDGTTTCVNSGSGAVPVTSAADSYSQRIDFVPALTLLREYTGSNVQVQYVGSANVNGAPADVIALSVQPAGAPPDFNWVQVTQRQFYIDQATSFVVKIQYTLVTDPASGSGPKLETFLSNYQTVSGFALPFQQSTYVDGNLTQTLTISSVAFNTGINPQTFQLTCGGN